MSLLRTITQGSGGRSFQIPSVSGVHTERWCPHRADLRRGGSWRRLAQVSRGHQVALQTMMASLIILVGTARPTVSLNTRGQLLRCLKAAAGSVEYSGGIIALAPGTDGNIPREMSLRSFPALQILAGFDRVTPKEQGKSLCGGTGSQVALPVRFFFF